MVRQPRRLLLAAGAAVLTAFAALIVSPSHTDATTVDVTIEHSRFRLRPGTRGSPEAAEDASSPTLVVPAGTTVRFTVRNLDPIDHELIVGPEAVQRRHELGTDPTHDGADGAVSVAAGGTAVTAYRFAASPGDEWLGCHLAGHWAYGMRVPVRVVDNGPLRVVAFDSAW